MNRRIGIASLIWTASIFLSRFVGLVRDRVLGSTLGVGPDADAYAAAFRIPDLFNYLLAGGALSIVFIPIFTAHLERGEEHEGWISFSNLANWMLLLMGILTPLVWVFVPEMSHVLAPGFDPARRELLIHLTRIVLPAQVFHLVGGLLSAALLSKDKHTVPALAPLLYNAGIIAGGLVMHSAEGFAWGVLIGAFVGPFLLPLIENLRTGLRWRPILSWRHPDFLPFLWRFVPVMVGQSIVAWDDTVLTRCSSVLAVGRPALLNYAKTLMRVPMGVFGQAMGYAAYPTLSRLWVEGKRQELQDTVTTATRRVLFLAFGSQVVLSAAGGDLALMVYTTRRIQPGDFAMLQVLIATFSVALGAWSAQVVIGRGFYAMGKTWLPTWLGTGVLVLAYPIYPLLRDAVPEGAVGLAIASSVAVTVYTVILMLLLQRQTGAKSGLSRFLARTLPATALGIGAGYGVSLLLRGGEMTFFAGSLRAIAEGGVGGLVFLGVCAALRVEEVGAFVRRVRRLAGGRPPNEANGPRS